MTQFFKKFPVINYGNTSAVNLMARVNMSKLALNSKQAYYSYQIPDGMRPDNLSYNYYDNPDYIWLINLANQIIDPYYDYPMSDSDVNSLIIQKYGSAANAQQIIDHFETNWVSDGSNISVGTFNALTPAQQKYWAPVVDQNNTIFEYVRKQEDWTVTTNQVQQLSMSYSVEITTEDGFILDTEDSFDLACPEGGNQIPFIAGEPVQQNGYTIGSVINASNTVMNIQHVSGQVVSPQAVNLVTTGAVGSTISTSNATAGIYAGMTVSTSAGTIPAGAVVVAVNTTPGSNSFTINATPTAPDSRTNYLTYSEQTDNAIWTKSASYVQTNILTYSEQFTNSVWTKSNVTIVDNVVLSPNGTSTTAASVTGTSSTSNQKYFTQSLNTSVAGPYTASFYLKAGTITNVVVRTNDNTGTNGARVTVDLAAGTLGTVSTDGTCTGSSATITDYNNGWYRVALTTTYVSALTSFGANVWIDLYGNSTNTGTFYVYGAQSVRGAVPGDYQITTTVTAAVQYLSPYQTLAAQKIIETTSSSQHYITSAIGAIATIPDNTNVAQSIYAKAGERSVLRVQARRRDGVYVFADYNLLTGVVAYTSSNISNTNITYAGNGWWRCSMTYNLTSGALAAGAVYMLMTAAYPASSTYTGNGTSGLYVYAAQVETATNSLVSYPTTYIPTTSATVTIPGYPYNITLGNTTFSTSVTGAAIGPITGLTSGAIATVSDIFIASQNIPTAEAQYWSPVTAYDIATRNNATNRNINLLNNSFAQQATKELKKLMSA